MRLKRPNLKRQYSWRLILSLLLVLLLVVAVGFQIWYQVNLRPVSKAATTRLFTVDEGSSASQIASGLQKFGLIRSSRAFIYYVNSKNYRNKLQAGTYKFSPAMPAQAIAKKLATGDIDKNWLTILPGKRLDQIEQEFIRSGFSRAQVDSAFDPSNYTKETAAFGLPPGASLEGLLYPDSFQKSANTPPSAIIKESLEEMQANLTPDIINGFSTRSLNTYQGITLASIVLKETDNHHDQPIVAQVLLSRLAQNMALQADATAFYAADVAGVAHSVSIDSAYNTYLHNGLPPGPIGNATASALAAVAHPANSDFLYYVTGDDGTTHFSHTQAEHTAAVAQYCKKLCQ